MAFKPLNALKRGVVAVWNALDVTRRAVMNLLFLLIIIVVVVALSSGGSKPLADKTALVMDLRGDLVEQSATSLRDALLEGVEGDSVRSIQLRDVLSTLDAAARDPKIDSVVLYLDQLQGGGMPMLREIGAALERVKKAGKPVFAWSDQYDQKRYLLASHASQIFVHPMGMVLIEGFGGRRNYYRDALDKLGVTVNLIKVGTYKSAAEPYIANGPSEAAREADSALYNAMWETYTGYVERQRGMKQGALAGMIAELPEQLAAQGGNAAQLALKAKLADAIKTSDEVRELMIKRGAYDDKIKSFRQVGWRDYLARHPQSLFGDAVGVVVAEGAITDGEGEAGSVGGRGTAKLIRQAREDKQIKALVLRVNSPGGSAFGSELVRRELELTRAAGKPVIVSMGNVAASGGYWVAMAADEVMADPSTITGSIGVFALLPTADKISARLGVHTDGVTTTWLADAYNPLRPLDPRFASLVQSSINNVYDEFTSKAAAARKMTKAGIDEVGQGRVWTGAQAKKLGLVDRLGGYRDALSAAAGRAKLGEDYRVVHIERPVNSIERFLQMAGASTAQALQIQVRFGLIEQALPAAPVAQVANDMAYLSSLTNERKPFAAVAHCMCAPW